MAAKHLEGKVAIVTGGAGGMGSWISRIFAEQGAKVVVADTGADVEGRMGVDPTRVDAVVDEIRKQGGQAVSYIGDIADSTVAEDLVRVALDTYGTIDILVCAHGILRERMIFNMDEEDWDASIRAHLRGCFAITKYVAIHFRSTRAGGRIVYFTSVAGVRGAAGQPNYSAAQQGKVGLMLAVAKELGRYGVTANCISPLAATRMTDRGRAVEGPPPSLTADGKPGDPKNVVPAIVYLCSDQGAEVTGRVVGATGNKVTVWREPAWTRTLYNEDPYWDIDTLFELMPETLGAGGFVMAPPQVP